MWLVASLLDSGVLDLSLSLRSKATLGNSINFSELNFSLYNMGNNPSYLPHS